MRRWGLNHALREKEGEGGGGGGDRKPDITAQIEGLIASHGDAKAALRVLYGENYELRDDRRKLREQLEGCQPVPTGGLVLDAAQAAAWKKYEALGKPEDLQAAVTERDELKAKTAKAERDRLAQAAAKACGFKPDVLLKMPGAEKLRFEVREEAVDGEKAEVAYVITDQQGATPQKLSEYAEANWKEFLPALEAGDEGDDELEDRQEPARRMVRQAPHGRPALKGAKPAEQLAATKIASGEYGGF
ncbi:MAG TPA: hypothetical protein VLH75_07295 [Longimicrobiales bacterium]|nr:hypothetical protein [Longimicrobiales bacterium]